MLLTRAGYGVIQVDTVRILMEPLGIVTQEGEQVHRELGSRYNFRANVAAILRQKFVLVALSLFTLWQVHLNNHGLKFVACHRSPNTLTRCCCRYNMKNCSAPSFASNTARTVHLFSLSTRVSAFISLALVVVLVLHTIF